MFVRITTIIRHIIHHKIIIVRYVQNLCRSHHVEIESFSFIFAAAILKILINSHNQDIHDEKYLYLLV